MKQSFRRLAVAAMLAAAAVSSHAAGIFGGFVQVDGQWYELSQPDSNGMPIFVGTNFGMFDAGSGSLKITGAEGLTWKDPGQDVTGVKFHWAVRELGSVTPFDYTGQHYAVGWTSNTPFNDANSFAYPVGGNQKWAQLGTTIDVLGGLVGQATPTLYELSVYLTASTTNGEVQLDNTNFVAQFGLNGIAPPPTPVPEPATWALLAVGAAGMTLRRRVHR